jgi:hypothetical protein
VTDLPLSRLAAFSTEELHGCAIREVRRRKRVYPVRIQSGRMAVEKAAAEIMMMEAIEALLRELARSERLL